MGELCSNSYKKKSQSQTCRKACTCHDRSLRIITHLKYILNTVVDKYQFILQLYEKSIGLTTKVKYRICHYIREPHCSLASSWRWSRKLEGWRILRLGNTFPPRFHIVRWLQTDWKHSSTKGPASDLLYTAQAYKGVHCHLSKMTARIGKIQKVHPEGSGKYVAKGNWKRSLHTHALVSGSSFLSGHWLIQNILLWMWDKLHSCIPGFRTNGNFSALLRIKASISVTKQSQWVSSMPVEHKEAEVWNNTFSQRKDLFIRKPVKEIGGKA